MRFQHGRPGRLTKVRIERSGPFDALATFQLLHAEVPYVPITDGAQLVKVIDRVGVATAIAAADVEELLGRR